MNFFTPKRRPVLLAAGVSLALAFTLFSCGENGKGNPVATTYTVTVNGGNGSGSYAAGATVTIAATAPSGQQFTIWTVNSGGATLANANSANTSFTMPANNVTVTANFTSGGGVLPAPVLTAQGSAAAITLSWTAVSGAVGYNVYGSDNSLAGFEMLGIEYSTGCYFPDAELNRTFYFKVAALSSNGTEGAMSNVASAMKTGGGSNNYTVTVNNGSGSGNYATGTNVTITATVPSGQQFTNWTTTSAGVTFANANSPSTTFTMPANAVTVTANFSGGGDNTTVTIVNNTTYAITSVQIKPTTKLSWGDDMEPGTLANGTSKTYTILPPYSATNQYDIRLMEDSDGNGNHFRKYNVTITSGTTITINAADFDKGTDLPTIYIRNRTGIAATSLRVRPSGTSDWSAYTATLGNNNDGNDGKGTSLGIAIPLTRYTVYDFELISSNPINTFAKNNVTIANGTILTFTSAQAATPIVGNPTIVIENNTGGAFPYIQVRATGTDTWSSNLSPGNVYDGHSCTISLPQPLASNNVYDIRLFWPGFNTGSQKNNVTVTEGMIVTFTN